APGGGHAEYPRSARAAPSGPAGDGPRPAQREASPVREGQGPSQPQDGSPDGAGRYGGGGPGGRGSPLVRLLPGPGVTVRRRPGVAVRPLTGGDGGPAGRITAGPEGERLSEGAAWAPGSRAPQPVPWAARILPPCTTAG